MGDYRWMTSAELETLDIEKDIHNRPGTGYVFEVDLEYPSNLHFAHNSFPLAPEKVDIAYADLSPYSKKCFSSIYGKTDHHATKLTATFKDRKNYLVHGLNLQFYLRKGLKLKKIHKGIAFTQDAFIRPFIEQCTHKRMTAATAVEQNMWKLVANSVYGKFIESPDNRMDCRFARSANRSKLNVSSPLYKGSMICGEDLTISFLAKPFTKMKQSWLVGFSILEQARLIMGKMYYDDLLPSFGVGNIAVVMSDTGEQRQRHTFSLFLFIPFEAKKKFFKRISL